MNGSWGGKRQGAGRFPQSFHLGKKAARSLSALTSHARMLNPEKTALAVLECLIEDAWLELEAQVEQDAQTALEGEEEYLNATKQKA